MSQELTLTPEIVAAEEAIKSEGKEVGQRGLQLQDFLDSTPNPLEIQEEDRYWRALSQQYTSYRKLLTSRAAKCEEQLRVLDEKKARWRATLAQIHDAKGIEAVVDRVGQALKGIDDVRALTQAELNRILNLQTEVSQQDQQITAVIGKLDQVRGRLRGRLLEQDSPPLWRSSEPGGKDESFGVVAHRSADRGFTGAGAFLRARKLRVAAILLLYVLTLLLALRFKRDTSQGRLPEAPAEAAQVLARPYSAALLVALLGTVGQMIAAPAGILFVVYVLYAVLMVRLTPLLTQPRVLPLLYALAAFSLLEGVYLFLQVSPLQRRELFALIVLAALLTFARLTRPAVLRQWELTDRQRWATVAGTRVGLALLGLSLLANLFGFVSLAQVLGVAALLGAFSGILLYGVVRLLTLMLILGLQTWAGSLSRDRRQTLGSWGGHVLAIAGFCLWSNTAMYLFAVRDTVKSAVASALKYPIGFAKVPIVVGDVLSLLLVLVIGYGLANVLTFLLREMILPKLRLQRGLPLAISTIVYYLLLVLVFFAALADAGVQLDKLTLITGALGIGVGFGLQNTVSNFVSGLMLLFERPIRVGDVVEVAGVVGSVRRIGVRSSTIHTSDDAEVIVPNNDLISNKVTNWTLSSPRRRVDIPVAVAYGTDPGPLLKVLVDVAESYTGVMRQPEPVAYFLGFGDSAMNFELRIWATQEIWFQLRSDVTVGVARALREAGIEIPFPQRDLHLRSMDDTAKNALYVAQPGAAPGERREPEALPGRKRK